MIWHNLKNVFIIIQIIEIHLFFKKINLMKNFKFKSTFIALSAICIAFFNFLGIIGHERINRAAVMALPKPLQTFFLQSHRFYYSESTVPDLRRNVINDKWNHHVIIHGKLW
jgi:hypothetical protein